MAKINHFLHTHPLMLTEEAEKNIDDKVVCNGCFNRLDDGPFYGCNECKFYLHKSCAERPREIRHIFHPCPLVLCILSHTTMCNACFKDVSAGLIYSCTKCNFDMHVKCTEQEEQVIHHFTHKHPLKLIDFRPFHHLVGFPWGKKYWEVRCPICDKQWSISWASSFHHCKECNFFIHTSCMINIPPQINHFFHPSRPLTLVTLPQNDRCNGCDKYSDLVFRCGKCQFSLDVKCALLPTVESEGADKIQHFAHGHPLALRQSKKFDNEVWCRACGENCSGLCFVCERCNFSLHRQCAIELPLETNIHHPFHLPHPLILSPVPWDLDHDIFPCRAWEGLNDRFMIAYHCVKCDFKLLIEYCAKPMLEHILFKYGSHPHFLRFCDKTRDQIYCDVCDWLVCNCFLQCVACELNIHLYCLPSTIVIPKPIAC